MIGSILSVFTGLMPVASNELRKTNTQDCRTLLAAETRELEALAPSFKVDQRLAKLYLQLGQISESKNDRISFLERGVDKVNQALKFEPDDIETLLLKVGLRGEIAANKKNLQSLFTIPDLEAELIQISTKSPLAFHSAGYLGLGKIYLNAPRIISLGSMKKAQINLERAFSQDPNWPENRLAYAEYLVQNENFREAKKLLSDEKFRSNMERAEPINNLLWSKTLAELEIRIAAHTELEK